MDKYSGISNSDVAIIGLGFRLPSGNLEKSLSEPKELTKALYNGFNGVVDTCERWSDSYSLSGEIVCKYAALLPIKEWKSFDPIMFGINPSEVSTIDPQQRLLLKCTFEALEDSGIDHSSIRGSNTSVFIAVKPSDIDYMECHGTDTPTGDPIELEGSSMVFKDVKSSDNPLLVGSIKSNIGHCEPASGVASVIKCCLSFKNKIFFPNIYFQTPNPLIKFKEWKIKVVTEPIKFNNHKLTSVIVNNFGVTGSNCCLILQDYNKSINNSQINNENDNDSNINNIKNNNNKYLIPFNSNSIKSLNDYLQNIKCLPESISFVDFIKDQIKFKSSSLIQRSVIIASSWEELKNKNNEIKAINQNSISNISINNRGPVTVFIYTVQNHFKENKTDEWTHCSSGNISLLNHNDQERRLNISELKRNCNYTKLTKKEFYQAVKINASISYKGLFQGIKECFLGDGCIFSVVSLSFLKEIEEFNHLLSNKRMTTFFNAAILDTCIHGTCMFLKEFTQVVFDRIEGFKYYSSNIPSSSSHTEIYVYSKLIKSTRNFIESSVHVMLEDGILLFEISKVMFSFLTPTIDSSIVSAPTENDIYLPYLQSKDSNIQNPSTFKSLNDQTQFQIKDDEAFKTNFKMAFSYYFFKNISKRHPTINKDRIMSKLIFPLNNDDPDTDNPQSLFENGLLDSVYKNAKDVVIYNKLLSQVVYEIVKPLLQKPIVFRIIEFGSGLGSLSCFVIEQLDQLLKSNPLSEISIEFTFSDVSSSFFINAKTKFSDIKNINIVYRVIDLDQSLVNAQDLKPAHYDIILMSNVLHVVKNIKSALNEIYKVLTPNGQLIFLEPPYKSIYNDTVFGVFDQW
ncbi:hypothetical protein DICPUDRAFT_148702 [Dictyostelium purpureum]|uniref:Uncharacterized protein n=1 Tax=Dictyostelium purpureum TaxID=5786 RepID=F0ZBS5_DICPU|nr:uncharacterized protein DICPUDRAFT_148702 [Dictyostelium purpureum]EGC38587.1 hypothetical protein DICPUDRAFT_148702 [Dictyostelium purpureum]|eukprot:XP_003284866.1 hypothetical protein DICPUDRAFT_148702 [Dictyostelium purpureum]